MSGSRIGNVAGLALRETPGASNDSVASAAAEEALRVLDTDLRQIFVEVGSVEAADGPIEATSSGGSRRRAAVESSTWETAFSKIGEDRVLVASSAAARWGIEVLLALTAWPENDATFLLEESDLLEESAPLAKSGRAPIAAIYRREAVLSTLRASDSERGPLGVARVSLADLGFGPEFEREAGFASTAARGAAREAGESERGR